MRTDELIKEIEMLPISKRMYVLEKTIHSIRFQDEKSKMELAAEKLRHEYQTNDELTIFTNLDLEDFYEAR